MPTITITITLYIGTVYYYYYYIIYLNNLLLLLLRHIFKQPITITIPRNIKQAYYYYFPDYYYYYYFPITITFIITVEPKQLIQSWIEIPILGHFHSHLFTILDHSFTDQDEDRKNTCAHSIDFSRQKQCCVICVNDKVKKVTLTGVELTLSLEEDKF